MKKSELFFAFVLLPLDIAMVLLSFIFAYYWRLRIDTTVAFSDIGLSEYLRYAFYLLPVWIGLFALNGLYAVRNSTGLFSQLYRIVAASSTAILLLIVTIFLSRSLFFSRLILVLTWIFSIILISFGRIVLNAFQRYLLKYGIGTRKVVLIGNNAVSEEIAGYFSGGKRPEFKVAGVIDDKPNSDSSLKYLGSTENIPMIIKKYSIDFLILTDQSIGKKRMSELIQLCIGQQISFSYVPDIFSILTANFQPALLGTLPVMELKQIPLDGWGRIAKRAGDILFSSLLLIALSPIFLLIAIISFFTSKGPIIYSSQRIGRDEKPFNFFKFRSMYIDKCDFTGGVKWTTEEDGKTRTTPFGRILRKTNLDELPQLWNILMGDMSFIGPRPEQPRLVKRFEGEIPDYFRRHRVKSGLTGWAQVNGLKGDTSISERVKYDIYYIENWSFWFDIKIIIKTVILISNEMFAGKSEYRPRP